MKAPTLKLGPLTIHGSQSIRVGQRTHGLPPDSQIVRVRRPEGEMVWVLTPVGTIHAVVEGGEVTVPQPLHAVVLQYMIREKSEHNRTSRAGKPPESGSRTM